VKYAKRDTYYPLDPLVEATGISPNQLSLRGGKFSMQAAKRNGGVNLDVAEYLAEMYGFHPYELWPTMPGDILEEANS
jgi:hypothetical protein